MPLAKKKAKLKKDSSKSVKSNGHAAARDDDGGATNSALDTIHTEITAPPEKAHIEQLVMVECPYCGDGFEVHVTSENDGQTLSESCHVCSRSVSIHVHAEDDELEVSAYRA